MKILNYFLEAKQELSKVAWPKKNDVIQYTALVIGVSVGVGIFFFLLDLAFTEGLAQFLKLKP